MEEKEICDKIIEFVKKNPDGVSIMDISRAIGVTRITASKYVYYLVGSGKLKLRKLGVYKILYPVKTQ